MTRHFGKLPAKSDPRTLRFADVLRAPAAVPPAWTFNTAFPRLAPHPVPMLANDRIGDCTLVSATHLQMGDEAVEHGRWPVVSEKAVVDLYWQMTGGVDSGLYLLDVANYWRTTGLPVGGKRERIAAYGAIHPQDLPTMRATCVARLGLWIGAVLPQTALDQLDAATAARKSCLWTVVGGGRGWRAQRRYGHAMRVLGYQGNGAWHLATWGTVVKATDAWMLRYLDEAYGVIDVIDKRVDAGAVREYLMDKRQPEVD